MAMEIVPFTQQDQEAASHFMRVIYAEMGWIVQPEDGLDDLAKFFYLSDDGFLFLIKDQEKIVRTGGGVRFNPKDMLLKRFYIAEEQRGSGIADKLLDAIVTTAKNLIRHGSFLM